MKYEIVCRWSTCDKEFHYELLINDIWICEVCSFEVIKLHIKKWFWRLQK